MIKLFRNIRKNLLAEGKTSRYLKYAIGEIILVVIGILIALSINNWNENRKERIQEISQLEGIKEDILLDLNDVEWNTNFHKETMKSEIQLLDYMMVADSKPKDSIPYEIALGNPIILTLHESSFSNLQNTNLTSISNKKLKKQIANYYDNFSKVILTIENDLVDYQSYSILRPYFTKYFKYKNKGALTEYSTKKNEDYYSPVTQLNKLILVDTMGLKNDEEFKIILAETIRLTNIKLQLYTDFSKRINELNNSITEELKILE